MANADESPPVDEEGDERADAEADQADAVTEAAEVPAAALEAEAAQVAAAALEAEAAQAAAAALEAEAAQAAAAALEAEAAQAAAAFVPAAAGTLAKAPRKPIVSPDAEDDPDLVEDDFDEAEGQMNAFRATCLVV